MKIINEILFNTLLAIISPSVFSAETIKFTYLDIVDDSISFAQTFYNNLATRPTSEGNIEYQLFPSPSPEHRGIPGYDGKRCIIDIEIALRLKEIQRELLAKGYKLKIFDAYRPQMAVDYKNSWKETPEDPVFKKFHHPRVAKSDFGKLSYMATKSSHTRGVAVDLTIVKARPSHPSRNPDEDFLGIWDPEELDMGNVGFIAMDPRSSHDFKDLNPDQSQNRKLLLELMWSQGFRKLRSEFWHYFYNMERNTDIFYNFPVRDDYLVKEDGTIIVTE